MSSSDPVVRLMRLMTHLNVGAALGISAWLLWSGWQLVTGQTAPAYSRAEVDALLAAAQHPAHSSPMLLTSVRTAAATGNLPCHEPLNATQSSAKALSGADL